MRMTVKANAIMQGLANDWAAEGFETYGNWVFAPGPGPAFAELTALGLIEPTGADEVEFRFTDLGQRWAMENYDGPVPMEETTTQLPASETASVLDDATRLLLHLNESGDSPRKGYSTFDGPELTSPLGLPPERVNDAVDILEENGWVESGRYLGTHPFSFKDVQLTARGRLEAQRLRGEMSAPSPIGNRDDRPPGPRINRSPNPIGSPFGFQDEDWESVDRDRHDSQRLVVVFGHQWLSESFKSDLLQENVRAMMQSALDAAIQHVPGRPAVTLDFRVLKAGYGSHIFNEIARDIIGADIAVFDTSDLNPNVMLELGVALTWGGRVLPIRESSTPVPPSDISGQTWTTYTDSGATWADREHRAKLVALVSRAIQKKLAAAGR